MSEEQKILLVLDLDETLIHATEQSLETPCDFLYEAYHVYLRPGLRNFLIEMGALFELAIWSSADDRYVNEIVNQICPNELNFEFVWGKSRCTLSRDYDLDQYVWEKRLKKLRKKGFRLEKILMVDDSPEKTKKNFGNAIYIKPFEGQKEDNELYLLAKYLQSLKAVSNVRKIEKRGWRINGTK